MAKKTILGIDIGTDRLKLALVKNGDVVSTAISPMPENLLKEGHITSTETMGELVRQVMKESGIRANYAACVLPDESVYVKNVDMPMMTADQLSYNLPFEFSDFITGDIKEYVFDYAVLGKNENNNEEQDPLAADGGTESEDNGSGTLNLMAVATSRSVIDDTTRVMRKAGLRLIKAAPALCTYIELIRSKFEELSQEADEFGILDLGYNAVRMYMYKGDRHVATRELEIGLESLDSVVADIYGVEVHLAHTYVMNNFDNCLAREECLNYYENIAVELMRAVNFYRFSNPDSTLGDMWVSGGGTVIQPLIQSIGEMLDMRLHDAAELVKGGTEIEECHSFVQAIGITMGEL